jgi:hypothetical protein
MLTCAGFFSRPLSCWQVGLARLEALACCRVVRGWAGTTADEPTETIPGLEE